MRAVDISQGVDPIPCLYVIQNDRYAFNVDGKDYLFDMNAMPFTLKEVQIRGHNYQCADKALILKHAHG